ncbi:MAG TPA: aminoglycoside phosphotransferase family protein, partial [Candidatus Dormibacteraeota bacterium]
MAEPEEESRLAGGFVNEVVRVGATVRRTAGPWTPAVHALLRHLERAGFAEAPRALGVDDRGREVLGFIEGETPGWTGWPDVLREGDGLAQLGALLRRYHEAVRGFRPPEGARWRNPLAPAVGEVVRHGDFAPFNTVWRGHRLVGVIDWDFAQPGPAISDLAYLAWYAVPLAGDRRVREYGFARAGSS